MRRWSTQLIPLFSAERTCSGCAQGAVASCRQVRSPRPGQEQEADRSAHSVGEASASGLALRTNPTPRILRIIGASFAASTLRRNRPR